MKELILPERIEQKIYLIRGQKVMLDRDLAVLYGVETRVLNQAVRGHSDRFPADFMFNLRRDEIMRISQIVTSSDIKFSKNVLAFTEQGVAMLSAMRGVRPHLLTEETQGSRLKKSHACRSTAGFGSRDF